MKELPGNESDQYEWNKLITKEIVPNNTYFKAVWLYSECYIYRKLKSIFEETQSLRDFDYFEQSKELELSKSMPAISRVIKSVNEFSSIYHTPSEVEEFFYKLLKQDLWGNRNDLSVTLGKEMDVINTNPLQELDKYNNDLLVDQTHEIWTCINADKQNKVIDVICDNSGYELLSDFVLCDFIIAHKLASKIKFRVKAIPWFISDVIPKDFYYTLSELEKSDDEVLREAGKKWMGYLESGHFVLEPVDHFFTSPYEFYKMEKIAPELYQSLQQSHLVIFKGDLNYRKLLADINWDPTIDFRTALNNFLPATNLCSLRTIKADLVCGLKPGQYEELWETNENWMASGQYGVIHFANRNTNV